MKLAVLVLLTSAAAATVPSPALACGGTNCTVAATSLDGSTVFIATNAQLVLGDTDASQDAYARSGGVTTLVSQGQINGNGAFSAGLNFSSDDGSKAFFETNEPLVATDTDTTSDIYERSGGMTTQVSTNTAGNANGAFNADLDAVSADGSKVFFETNEQLAATDTDMRPDIYERSGGTTTQVSTNTGGNANGAFNPQFKGASADGSKVFLDTSEQLAATDMDVAGLDTYERSGGTTVQVSTNTAGDANGVSDVEWKGASADGSKVFFQTDEQLAASDMDAGYDIYERSGGMTTQVSTNTANMANGAFDAAFRGASADGSKVFISTTEQLAASDMDARSDVYERSGGTTTTQVSTNTANMANGAFDAGFSGASADASKVFFTTGEPLAMSDMDASNDIYERSGGMTTQVSTNTAGNANGAFAADFRDASADGSRVIFITAEQLAGSDADMSPDLYERAGGTTTQVSTNTAGNANGAFSPEFKGVSPDGSKVIFQTDEQLAAGDTDMAIDAYERSAGVTTLLSPIPPPPLTNPPPPQITPATPTIAPTGQRAAALKKCKKKRGRARSRCKRKANLLPV